MPDPGLPYAGRHRPSREGNGNRQLLAVFHHRGNGQLIAGVGLVMGYLVTLWVYFLDEISLFVQQPHGHKGQAQITCRLTVVASQNAQATGIDGEAFVEPEFGAEIGHQRSVRVQFPDHLRIWA